MAEELRTVVHNDLHRLQPPALETLRVAVAYNVMLFASAFVALALYWGTFDLNQLVDLWVANFAFTTHGWGSATLDYVNRFFGELAFIRATPETFTERFQKL